MEPLFRLVCIFNKSTVKTNLQLGQAYEVTFDYPFQSVPDRGHLALTALPAVIEPS